MTPTERAQMHDYAARARFSEAEAEEMLTRLIYRELLAA